MGDLSRVSPRLHPVTAVRESPADRRAIEFRKRRVLRCLMKAINCRDFRIIFEVEMSRLKPWHPKTT